jgi:hypothetical protein
MKDSSSLKISNLASFAKLERFLEARRDPSSKESELNFEEFEVRVGRLSHELESEIKALELSRYDVEVSSISINGWQAADSYHPKSSTKQPRGKGLETPIEQLQRRRDVCSRSRTPPRTIARKVGFLTYDGTR